MDYTIDTVMEMDGNNILTTSLLYQLTNIIDFFTLFLSF